MNLAWNYQRRRASQQSRTITLFAVITFVVFHLWAISAYGAAPQPAVVESTLQTNAASQLFFPVIYSGYTDGFSTWHSTLVLQNGGNTMVQGQITFYDENGQSITPFFSDFTVSNPFSLSPLNSLVIPVAGANLSTNKRYSAVISSDQPLAGVHWISITDGSGKSSHGMVEGLTNTNATTIFVPAIANNFSNSADNFTSKLAIQNLSNSVITNITLKFYNASGNQVMQSQLPAPLAPYATWHPNLNQIFGSSFSGSLVVSASSPVALVHNKWGAGSGAVLLSHGSGYSSETTLYAPFLSTAANASVSIDIQNTSDNQMATVTLTHSDNIGNTQVQIPPNSSTTIEYTAGSHSGLFAATLVSTQPIVAIVTSRTSDGRGFSFEASAQAVTNFLLPLLPKSYSNSFTNNQFNSNAIFYNATNAQAQVMIDYPNLQTRNVAVDPGQTFRFLPATDDFINPSSVGSVRVSSTQPLFAVVSAGANGSGIGDTVASYNAIPAPASSNATPTPTPLPPTVTPTKTITPTPSVTPTRGSPTPPPTAPPTPTLPASDATTVAQPGQPATLTFSDPGGGKVTVQVPAGAVTQNTTLLYDDQATLSHPGAFSFAGRTFTLTAYRSNTPQSGFTFQQPVTLTIEYTDADVAGLNENELALFFYDTGSNSWSEGGITVVTRDTANNRLIVQINHLTEFAMGTVKKVHLPIVSR